MVFREDTSYLNHLVNWGQEMGLMCTDHTTVAYIEIAYFVCFGAAGMTMFVLPDKWGPKTTMTVFGTCHVAA
jgi:hypothetical protein